MDATIRVPAIEKLLDLTASGIGAIAGPMLAPWRAGREAEAKRIAARGEADVLAILAEGQAGALPTIAEAQATARRQLAAPGVTIEGELAIAGAVEQRVRFQEEKRLRNIATIVGQAAAQVPDDEVQDDEPDHDWTARFFNEAQDVSSEDMQTLWAKVLAGEVERPGSTSIRTLGVLRDLDRSAATTFQRLCSIAVSIKPDGRAFLDARVPSLGGNPGQNALRSHGLGFDQLNILNEHGLIISDYNSWYDFRVCIGLPGGGPSRVIRIPFCFQNRFWVLESLSPRDSDQEFRLSGVGLTQAGRELSRVVELAPSSEYMRDLMSFFEKHHLRMVEVDSAQAQILPRGPS